MKGFLVLNLFAFALMIGESSFAGDWKCFSKDHGSPRFSHCFTDGCGEGQNCPHYTSTEVTEAWVSGEKCYAEVTCISGGSLDCEGYSSCRGTYIPSTYQSSVTCDTVTLNCP